MTPSDKYRLYLSDLGDLVKDLALKVKKKEAEAKGTSSFDFESGRLMAFIEVLSLMQQQAQVFEIPMVDLKLENFDPETDLLSTRK